MSFNGPSQLKQLYDSMILPLLPCCTACASITYNKGIYVLSKAVESFFIYAHIKTMHTFLFVLVIYLYEDKESLQLESLFFRCSGDFTKEQVVNHSEYKAGNCLN